MKVILLPAVLLLTPLTALAALTGHWECNDATGTTASNSANPAFPGTLSGFAAGSEWTTGSPGGGSALLFDGVDDIVTTAFAPVAGSAPRSLAAWIRYPAQTDAELDGIFSYGTNATSARWTVRIGSGAGVDQNRLRLEVSGGGVYGNTDLNDDQWHHVAVVQTGGTLADVALYVDGVAQTLAYNGSGSGLAINTAATAGFEAAIGGSRHATNYNWLGAIDDVRFYDHALSAAEVTALATANPAPVITSFSATPSQILPGQSAVLAWTGTAKPDAVWTISPAPGNVTPQTAGGSGNVSVSPAATTTYTLTVTDSTGSATADAIVGVGAALLHPAINEVMAANDGYLADENRDTPDWIELRNPNASALPVSGYHLRDGGGSDWVIPPGVTIAAGGYLRIFASGKNRAVAGQNLHTDFSLGSDGELLELRAPGSTEVVDSMPAGILFPDNVSWGRISNGTSRGYLLAPTPAAANSAEGNPGPLIGKVRTGLTDGAGAERQPVRPASESGTVAADSVDQFSGVQGQNGWNYGYTSATLAAYTPASFTTFPGGSGQGAWSAAAQNWNTANTQWGASWERGLTGSPNTDLGADYTLPSLTGGSSSPVRRWTSTFSGTAVLSGYVHHVLNAGDGTQWQLYLNGTPLLDGDLVTAGQQVMTVRTTLRRFAVPVTLTAGDIVDLVCHAGATETSDTSRAWLRVWREPETFSAAVHDAVLPVTTTFQPTAGTVTGATLFYVVGFGTEQSLPMSQLDGVWRADIPLSGVVAGEMIRWRISATDSAGGTRKSPPNPSATDSPVYHGSVARAADEAARSRLGKLSLFIRNIAASEATGGTRASIFWNGTFYDNVDINLHSSNAYAKRSWDMDFNQGHRFRFTADGAGHTDINILTNWRDRSKLRSPQSYHMFRLAGHPTLPCETVRLELNGLFHSTCDLTGELNEGVLEDAGLDRNGSLYKMQNLFNSSPSHATSGVEKRTRKWEAGNADLAAYLAGLVTLSATDNDTDPLVNNSPRFRFLTDNADMPGTINFLAAMFWSTSYDWGHKNYALYRDSEGAGRWTPVPWDLDLSWGHYYDAAAIANTYFDDVIRTNTNDGTIHNFSLYHNQMEFVPPNRNALFAYVLEDPTLRAMVLQRLRNLADQYFLPAGPAPEIEGRMNRLTDLVDPPDFAESDADLDLRVWGYWNQHQTASNTYTPRSAREETGRITGTFVPARRGMYFSNSPALSATYGGPVPAAQPAAPQIVFGTYDSSPASGNQDHEYIELVNTTAAWVDLTGWTLEGGVRFTFPGGSVITPQGNVRFNGRLIVAKSAKGWNTRTASPRPGEGRFLAGAYEGQLSSAGETVELRNPQGQTVATLTIPATPGEAQRWLRITELHYNPPAPTPGETAQDALLTGADFEFIELMNTSTGELDISGCYFDEGITFTFPAGTLLTAGQRIVVARKPSALAMRAPALPAASRFGPWTGSLDNAGERITLRDAIGEQIVSFSYDDKAPWPVEPDGQGSSVVLIAAALDPDMSTSWRSSLADGGSPGTSDAVSFTGDAAADLDRDGRPALMEYALGTSDMLPDWQPPLQFDPATGRVTVTHALAADDVILTVEVSADLLTWDSTAAAAVKLSASKAGTQVEDIWSVTIPGQSAGRGYVRLRAVRRGT